MDTDIDASHSLSLQIPGFNWLVNSLLVDWIGKVFKCLRVQSIIVSSKIQGDWRLDNALKLLIGVSFISVEEPWLYLVLSILSTEPILLLEASLHLSGSRFGRLCHRPNEHDDNVLEAVLGNKDESSSLKNVSIEFCSSVQLTSLVVRYLL